MKQWIFKKISIEIKQGDAVAITGQNGSGKSTLLKIISGFMEPSGGEIEYCFNQKKIDADQLYQYISMSAPYLELVEEFTLIEMLSFYLKFKPFNNHYDADRIIETTGLGYFSGMQIKYFSSGMKQRLKLGMALMTEAPMVLLDEPLSNLDAGGCEWFQEMIKHYGQGKILLISSNQAKQETNCCNKFIHLDELKRIE